jgi:hypothetical protein
MVNIEDLVKEDRERTKLSKEDINEIVRESFEELEKGLYGKEKRESILNISGDTLFYGYVIGEGVGDLIHEIVYVCEIYRYGNINFEDLDGINFSVDKTERISIEDEIIREVFTNLVRDKYASYTYSFVPQLRDEPFGSMVVGLRDEDAEIYEVYVAKIKEIWSKLVRLSDLDFEVLIGEGETK